MTIGEAINVSTLLKFLADHPSGVRYVAPAELNAIAKAGAELARRVHETLAAGYTEAQWLKRWECLTREPPR
jgi:hypothetical protein